MKMPRSLSRTSTKPLAVPRTMRNHDIRLLTSLPAGKMVPLAAIPLLREDAVPSGRMRISFESMETAEILMNAINVNVKAYLVPHLAFERFPGMDSLNRSYEGIPDRDGDPVIPYIERQAMPAHGVSEVLTHMGKHARPGQMVNTAYVEAYNAIWNFRASNRSPDISERSRLDHTLAPAFWQHSAFQHIVPDFDQAVIDGEVALNVVNSKMPVHGIGLVNGFSNTGGAVNVREPSSTYTTSGQAKTYSKTWDAARGGLAMDVKGPTGSLHLDIFTEMEENGITVSLSNIEMARKTQAFAKLRSQYSGHSDEWLIDLLMDGITVPEQAWRQPILLSEKSTIFGMSKRYASDGANLTESVVNGATFVDLNIATPKVPTGGVIMVVAEITPEQLFERSQDAYFHVGSVAELPQYLRDTLDPEKVEVVKNEYIDIDHDTPNATFGYAPLNHKWNYAPPCIGGRFYRPQVDAGFDEDRQRLWAVETQNPVLSEDFYLCTNIHTKPFVVTNEDPFEAVAVGGFSISGNTVFGGVLVEANNDYEQVVAEQPQTRIAKPE